MDIPPVPPIHPSHCRLDQDKQLAFSGCIKKHCPNSIPHSQITKLVCSKIDTAIAAAQGNVVEVLHTRHGEGLEIGEVELRVSVETMGHEHRERVIQALKDAGLQPRITQG